MFNPNLVVIAGCNRADKSTYFKNFLPKGLIALDADSTKKKIYDAFSFDFEVRDLNAWNKTYVKLKSEIEIAIEQKKNFDYEMNFHPLWTVGKVQQPKM